MGLIVRSDLVGTKYLEGYPQIREMLQQVGWLQFLEKFNGFHKEVTKTFARSFNGSEVEIGVSSSLLQNPSLQKRQNYQGKVNDGSKTRNFTMRRGGKCSKHQVWIFQFSRRAFLAQH